MFVRNILNKIVLNHALCKITYVTIYFEQLININFTAAAFLAQYQNF